MGKIIKINFYTNGGDIMCTILKKIRNKQPDELLKEYGIDTTPPIDISKLLEKIGISSIAKDFSNIEKIEGREQGSILGAAFSYGEYLTIFYRKTDSFHRKKFTIAHELAHCCFDCPNDEATHIEYRTESHGNVNEDEIEKENRANIFAGELLIPKKELLDICSKMIIPSLTALSKIFDVSIAVMAARLDHLNVYYYKDSTI